MSKKMSRFVFFNFSGLEKATVLNDTFLKCIIKELSKTGFKSFDMIRNVKMVRKWILHTFKVYNIFLVGCINNNKDLCQGLIEAI